MSHSVNRSGTTATYELARSTDIDAHLVNLWLHARSPHIQRAFSADAERLFAFESKSRYRRYLWAFADSLQTWRPARPRTLAAIKSRLAFGQRTGYVR